MIIMTECDDDDGDGGDIFGEIDHIGDDAYNDDDDGGDYDDNHDDGDDDNHDDNTAGRGRG